MARGPQRSRALSRRAAVFTLAALFAIALGVGIVRYISTAPMTPAGPRATAAPPGTPVFQPAPATRMTLATQPLGISPDGFARWLVRVRFADAQGAPVQLVRGGDIAFAPTHGTAQWQTRLRFGGPAAVVSTTIDGPLGVAVRANPPLGFGSRRAVTNTRVWAAPRTVAAALGPHLIQLGWFPVAASTVYITALDEHGGRRTLAVKPPSSTYRDTAVEPGERERYSVTIPGRYVQQLVVAVPPEPVHKSLAALAGKGMWLSFSPTAGDARSYETLDPRAMIARATAAGIRFIELRTTYGPFSEITPDARAKVDALIDAAAAHGIATVAWTVPRGSDYDDLAAGVAAAYYRTRRGNGFAALAVDLERGGDFLGDGPAGFTAIAEYATRLREALGTSYPLIATVEDPYLGHLGGKDYPYAVVAAHVDVLQPMTYWRMMSARAESPEAVSRVLRESYAATLLVAHRPIAIDIGGQTVGDGPRGAPPPDEIVAAVRAARDTGALGLTFFDWNGTSDAQWSALTQTPWAERPSP